MTAQATRIIFVRHGQTAHNREKRLQGHHDAPLDDTGEGQAQKLARHLRALGMQNPTIHSSDLKRAHATARAIQAEVGGTLATFAALREIHLGDWEDQLYADIEQADPEGYARFWGGEADYRPPQGESPAEVAGHVLAHVQAHWPQPGETLLVVSHGVAITGVLCKLLGRDYGQVWQSREIMHQNTGFSVLNVDPATHEILGQELAQHPHLA